MQQANGDHEEPKYEVGKRRLTLAARLFCISSRALAIWFAREPSTGVVVACQEDNRGLLAPEMSMYTHPVITCVMAAKKTQNHIKGT